MTNDEHFMQRCFDLAKDGLGHVSPNPLVGSVIVKDSHIIAEGYHQKVGLDHAEIDAIKKAKVDLKGSTLYCNLEPCCHTNKRTPPCAQRIIKEGIKKVVISNLDPNPEVAGKGVKILQDAGITVITGILKDKGEKLNEIFFHHILAKRPFIHLKMAQTLDGKLASKTQDSKWITSVESREHVHQQRAFYDAILVGANTVRVDNPSLTVRLIDQPVRAIYRIVLSQSAKLDPQATIFQDEFRDKTIVIVPQDTMVDLPTKIIHCPLNEHNDFDLQYLMQHLYQEFNICSVFIEGGQKVHTSFIEQHLYDRLSIYMAPKILGTGHNTIGDLGNELIADAISFKQTYWQQIGPDILFSAKRN